MPAEFIYSTYKLARHYPPDRTVLEDISISFYPGAKIGVIGPNGAGKSSLMRIMAGLDDGFTGDARLTPGLHRRLPEPGAAARSRQGRQGQRDGRRPRGADAARAVQRRDGEVVRARRRLRGDRRGAELARGPDQRRRRLERRAQRRDRDGGAALPARRRGRDDALRRREATRRPRPAPAPPPGPAAARRADEPPRRRVGRVARAVPRRVRGDGRRRHPRSLLPRQRREVDPRARSRPRDPVLGQLLRLAGAEARPDVEGAEDRGCATAHAGPGARVGAHGREGPPGEGQGPPVGLRAAAGRGERRQGDDPRARDRDPARAAARRPGDRGREPAQGLRRPAADRGPDVLAAAGRHRRDHRAQRGGQDDAVPDARRPGGARRRRGRRSGTRSS